MTCPSTQRCLLLPAAALARRVQPGFGEQVPAHPGAPLGQSDLGKLLLRGRGPSGDDAFPGSDAVSHGRWDGWETKAQALTVC